MSEAKCPPRPHFYVPKCRLGDVLFFPGRREGKKAPLRLSFPPILSFVLFLIFCQSESAFLLRGARRGMPGARHPRNSSPYSAHSPQCPSNKPPNGSAQRNSGDAAREKKSATVDFIFLKSTFFAAFVEIRQRCCVALFLLPSSVVFSAPLFCAHSPPPPPLLLFRLSLLRLRKREIGGY